jgi:hypothetical protein
MKKFVWVLLICFIIPTFASGLNIADYFPITIGNTWAYASNTGQITEVRRVVDGFTDSSGGGYIRNFLSATQVGQTQTLHRVTAHRVYVLVTTNIFGTPLNHNPAMPILAPPGQSWRHNDRGDDLHFNTSRASVTVGDRVFENCIVVEQRIVVGNNAILTRRSYFAKGIGLVLVTTQSPGGEPTIFMQLVDYSVN